MKYDIHEFRTGGYYCTTFSEELAADLCDRLFRVHGRYFYFEETKVNA